MKTWRGGGVQERAVLSSVASGARLSPCLYLSGHNTAEYTARPTALTMAVASKAVIDALYHRTFHFCIEKKFRQPFLNKSESE